MKVSVSLADTDVAFLDDFARKSGLESRSAAIQQAVRSLRVAELGESYAAAWDAIGSAHARTGHYEQAIRDYREGLRVDPDLAQTHNNLGLALAAAARWDEAVASYERAIRLSPRFRRDMLSRHQQGAKKGVNVIINQAGQQHLVGKAFIYCHLPTFAPRHHAA